MRGKNKNRIYPFLTYPGAVDRAVVACSDQVEISHCYLWSTLPVTKIFPGVVWFGEIPHHLQEIDKIVQKADLAIIVGTSSTVRRTGEEY